LSSSVPSRSSEKQESQSIIRWKREENEEKGKKKERREKGGKRKEVLTNRNW